MSSGSLKVTPTHHHAEAPNLDIIIPRQSGTIDVDQGAMAGGGRPRRSATICAIAAASWVSMQGEAQVRVWLHMHLPRQMK
jgi:hypothetical protein